MSLIAKTWHRSRCASKILNSFFFTVGYKYHKILNNQSQIKVHFSSFVIGGVRIAKDCRFFVIFAQYMRRMPKYYLLLGFLLCGCAKSGDIDKLGEDISAAMPKIVSVEATPTSNSIIVEAVLDKTDGITEYGVRWGLDAATRTTVSNDMVEKSFSCHIDNLDPQTEYHFLAYISNGISEIVSQEKSITTLPAPEPEAEPIEDPVLREYIMSNYDTDRDGSLSVSEAEAVTNIGITNNEVASIKGVELFPHLMHLAINGVQNRKEDPSNGRLTYADLRKNTQLREVHFEYQNLEEINVGENVNLRHLGLFKCPLRKIDISSNTGLVVFGAGYCQLDSIDLTHNLNLESIHLDHNKLQKISLGTNNALKYLDLNGNLLNSLDVSGCIHLQELYCANNPHLKTIYVNKGQVFGVFQHDEGVQLVPKD